MAIIQQDDWTQKSSEEVAAVLLGESPVDRDRAMALLMARYRKKLTAYMRRKLPADAIDDAIMDTWLSFYEAVLRDQSVRNVQALLNKIAHRRRVDAVRKLVAEREIELDHHPSNSEPDRDIEDFAGDRGIEEQLQRAEEVLREDFRLEMQPHLPFLDKVLSDCQRVLWVLCKIHGYPSKPVARMMGKSVDNVDVQTKKARHRVARHFTSDEVELALVSHELGQKWRPSTTSIEMTMIERFAEPALPHLTPDELKPLGLTNRELQENYYVSLMLPRWYNGDGDLVPTPPFLVLTRRPDWAQMQNLFARLKRDPEDVPDEFPEEALIRVDVEQDYIHLRVEPIHQMVPDDPEFSLEPDTYLAVHKPRIRLPVILGAYSRSLYTPELLQRWPFVNAENIPE